VTSPKLIAPVQMERAMALSMPPCAGSPAGAARIASFPVR
jgi:hypothetical protein